MFSQDFLYWTDWETESIHKVHKFKGGEVEHVATGLYSPMDIHIYHKYKQPQLLSVCGHDNGGCSHLCLPLPHFTPTSAKYRCACPDNLHMSHDGKSCTNDNGDIFTRPPTYTHKPDKPLLKPGSSSVPSSQETPKSTTEDDNKVRENGMITMMVVGILVGVVLFLAVVST